LQFRRSGGEVAQILAVERQDLRGLPLGLRKTNLARLLARRPDGIFVAPADSDDFAQAFRFQIARDSDLISPTVPT
jgi:hypothetical protein